MTTNFVAAAMTGLLTLPAALDASTPANASGTAEALVLHSVTRQPLAEMPVYVARIDPPEGVTGVQVFITGKDGRAFMTPLETGNYAAWVEWNNNRSELVQFFINADTDVVVQITILFNPDID